MVPGVPAEGEDDYVGPPTQPELGPPYRHRVPEYLRDATPKRVGPVYEDAKEFAACPRNGSTRQNLPL